MFEKLCKRRAIVARYYEAPYAKERQDYLIHLSKNGYRISELARISRELIWVARKLSVYPSLQLTPDEVKKAGTDWKVRRRKSGRKIIPESASFRFILTALPWLRYLGCLRVPNKRIPFLHLQKEYSNWMLHEKGLSPKTIYGQSAHARYFLCRYIRKKRPISKVRIKDIDAYLIQISKHGWSRRSVKDASVALRMFFRYLGHKGHCSNLIARVIEGPKIYRHESLPMGPSWKEAKRLLADTRKDSARDIRDRAIILIFVLYGLRACELENLTLDDVDWDHEKVLIRRAKRVRPHVFPLVPLVGNALVEYLKKVRPQSPYRQIFLNLKAPIKPMRRSGMYCLIKRRFVKLGIKSLHYGPHALRHTCASRFLQKGFSLKQIGDHLGHHCHSSTQIYAKVDILNLRKVASYDLGGLL